MQEKGNENLNGNWAIQAFILTFVLSGMVSFLSNNGIQRLNIFSSIIILIVVVFIGIFFDLIGVAVTVAPEEDFHAKATKKSKRSKNIFKTYKKCFKSCKCMCGCNR